MAYDYKSAAGAMDFMEFLAKTDIDPIKLADAWSAFRLRFDWNSISMEISRREEISRSNAQEDL